jgi:hypothetical protein
MAMSGNDNSLGEREPLWHGSLAIEHAFNPQLNGVLDLGAARTLIPQTTCTPPIYVDGFHDAV